MELILNLFLHNGLFEETNMEPADMLKTNITKEQNRFKPKSTYAHRTEASAHEIKMLF
jgi:hypothetical protein